MDPLWPFNTSCLRNENQSKQVQTWWIAAPRNKEHFNQSYGEKLGVRSHPETEAPLEVNLNFQRNPIKTVALKRETLAGHLLCDTASVQEKIRYFLTMAPGEIGPIWCGFYKSQHFLLCGGNVESALKQRLFVYQLSLFSSGHTAILLLRWQKRKDRTQLNRSTTGPALYKHQTPCSCLPLWKEKNL